MIARRSRVWLAAIVLLCAILPARAQTRPTKPLPAVEGAFEKTVLTRPASLATRPTSPAGPQAPQMLTTGMDTTRVVLSLALVLTAIFLLRWIAQQYFGAPSTKRSTRAVQLLSRSMIAPKQHVLVIQVGRRLVVVGDNGTAMNPLCEITDADEIALFMGQLRQDKADPVKKAFSSVFGKAQKDFSDDSPDDGRSPANETEDPELDPGLATTQAELSGLIDKVRSVSKQIGQG